MKEEAAKSSSSRRNVLVKTSKALTHNELRPLLNPPNGAGGRVFRSAVIVRLVSETAIRPDEIALLEKCDVDVERGRILIRRRHSPFNYEAKRDVPISDPPCLRIEKAFASSSIDDQRAIPSPQHDVVNAVLHIQHKLRLVLLRVGLTTAQCSIERREPNAAAFNFQNFRSTALEARIKSQIPNSQIAALFGSKMAWSNFRESIPRLTDEDIESVKNRVATRYLCWLLGE